MSMGACTCRAFANTTMPPYLCASTDTTACPTGNAKWRELNVSIWGGRFIRLHVGRLTIDLYRAGCRTFTATGGGADGTARYWMLFTPIGEVTWVTRKANNPRPDREEVGE